MHGQNAQSHFRVLIRFKRMDRKNTNANYSSDQKRGLEIANCSSHESTWTSQLNVGGRFVCPRGQLGRPNTHHRS
jgi:hypothetical protein